MEGLRGDSWASFNPAEYIATLPDTTTTSPVRPPSSFPPQQAAPSIQLWVTAWPQGYPASGRRTSYLLGLGMLLSWV